MSLFEKDKFFSFIFRFLLFVLIAGIGVAADLVTKSRVFQALGMPGTFRQIEEPELIGIYWVWKDVLGLQTSLNEGALFGMGQGQIFWLAFLSVVFLIGIFIWVIHSAWKSRFLLTTLGLIVAGIIGNLYDRLGWHGLIWNNGEPVYAVRDWILVMLGSYPWPNFNIADSMLVCGAFLLAFHSFFINDAAAIPVERAADHSISQQSTSQQSQHSTSQPSTSKPLAQQEK
ncbi:MAG: signal peptidase II [Planctomycetaceae bacterium]|jgi:signal peptidase II|nr:signal peptidase II [Planctomycetaceae bacterium]